MLADLVSACKAVRDIHTVPASLIEHARAFSKETIERNVAGIDERFQEWVEARFFSPTKGFDAAEPVPLPLAPPKDGVNVVHEEDSKTVMGKFPKHAALIGGARIRAEMSMKYGVKPRDVLDCGKSLPSQLLNQLETLSSWELKEDF